MAVDTPKPAAPQGGPAQARSAVEIARSEAEGHPTDRHLEAFRRRYPNGTPLERLRRSTATTPPSPIPAAEAPATARRPQQPPQNPTRPPGKR